MAVRKLWLDVNTPASLANSSLLSMPKWHLTRPVESVFVGVLKRISAAGCQLQTNEFLIALP